MAGTGICKADGCNRQDIIALSYCSMHFSRWHRNGSVGEPTKRTNLSEVGSEEFRIWFHRQLREQAGPLDTPCLIWTKCIQRKGYGEFRRGGKPFRAHRVAWELVNGPVPDGLFVCHTCDVPACCNPDHLWTGTAKQNSEDMVAKNRSWSKR